MATRSTFTKPPHISDRAWALAGRMTLRQLAGQLTSIDPGRYQQLAGEDIALAVARGEIGGTGLVGDRLRELQEIAIANGHPPLLVKDDGRRGFYLVAPFPLYCFDMRAGAAGARAGGDRRAPRRRDAGAPDLRLCLRPEPGPDAGRRPDLLPALHERRDPRQHRGPDRVRPHRGDPEAHGSVPVHGRSRLHGPADRAHRVPRDRAAALRGRVRGGGAGGHDELRGAERRARACRPVPARPGQGQRGARRHHRVGLRRDLRALRRVRLREQSEGGGAARVQRGRRAYRPLLAPLPPLPAGARGGGTHQRGGTSRCGRPRC